MAGASLSWITLIAIAIKIVIKKPMKLQESVLSCIMSGKRKCVFVSK